MLRAIVDHGVKKLGVLVLGRSTVDIHDEILVAVVDGLEGGAWFDVDQATGWYVVPLRLVTEVHGQGPGEDHERLLLERMAVTASSRTGLVSPHVAAAVRKAGQVGELGDVPCRLTWFMRACDPLE